MAEQVFLSRLLAERVEDYCDASGVHTYFYGLTPTVGARCCLKEENARWNLEAQTRLYTHLLAPQPYSTTIQEIYAPSMGRTFYYYFTERVITLRTYYDRMMRIGESLDLRLYRRELCDTIERGICALGDALKKINYPTQDNHWSNIGFNDTGLVLIDFSDEIWGKE